MVQQNLQDRVALLEQHRDTWNHRANRYFKYGSTYLGIAGVITTECILIQSSGFLDVRNLISDAGKVVQYLIASATTIGFSASAIFGGIGLYNFARAALSGHQANLLEDRVAELKQAPEYSAQQQPNPIQS